MKRSLLIIIILTCALLPHMATAAVPASVSRAVAQAKQSQQLQVSCTINGHPGSITLAGNCFSMDLGPDKILYDGETQWTYSAADNEVTIFNPTPEELALVNPLQLLGRLEADFSGTPVVGAPNSVTLSRINPNNDIKEIIAIFNPATGWPSEMIITGESGEAVVTDINITPLTKKLTRKNFKFSAPSGATITDLR